MSRKFAVIAGAIILVVGAVAASFAYLGNDSTGATGGSGATPNRTISDGAGGMGDASAAATTTSSHQMADGSLMDGMDMGN